MRKTFLLVACLFITLLLSESVVAQSSGQTINLLIKSGNFDHFYGEKDIYTSSIQKADVHPKTPNASGAYLNLFYEIPIAENITVSPSIGADIGFDWFLLGARADYYFHSHIPNLPEQLDLYGGADSGFILGLDGDKFMINAHAGGEWKFNESWGGIVEFGFGSTKGSFGAGVGYHF